MEKMYKPRAAAELVGVHYETILDWIGAGTLPALMTPSGQYRIAEYDLDAALLPVGKPKRNKKKPQSHPVTVIPWQKNPTQAVAPAKKTARRSRWSRCRDVPSLPHPYSFTNSN
jgi:excisionase family DNA binding protein